MRRATSRARILRSTVGLWLKPASKESLAMTSDLHSNLGEAAAFDVATCPLARIPSMDQKILQDPYPYFARLRREAPVYRDVQAGFISVATYDLIRQVTSQPNVFSNAFRDRLRAGGTGAI